MKINVKFPNKLQEYTYELEGAINLIPGGAFSITEGVGLKTYQLTAPDEFGREVHSAIDKFIITCFKEHYKKKFFEQNFNVAVDDVAKQAFIDLFVLLEEEREEQYIKSQLSYKNKTLIDVESFFAFKLVKVRKGWSESIAAIRKNQKSLDVRGVFNLLSYLQRTIKPIKNKVVEIRKNDNDEYVVIEEIIKIKKKGTKDINQIVRELLNKKPSKIKISEYIMMEHKLQYVIQIFQDKIEFI